MNNLTIIIAVHNAPYWTKHCLEHLFKNTETNHSVIVIDNNSTPKTIEMLKHFKNAGYINTLIENKTNMGSHYAWNQGLNYVETEFAAIIHTDCLVSPKWDRTLLTCLERDNNIKAVSPITNYSDQFYLRYSQLFFDDYVQIKPANKTNLDYNDIKYLLDDYYLFHDNFENFSRKVFEKFNYSFRFLSEMGTHCIIFKTEALISLDCFDIDFFPHFGAEKILLKKMNDRGWDYISSLGCYVHHHGNATSDGPGFNMSYILNKNEILVNNKIERY